MAHSSPIIGYHLGFSADSMVLGPVQIGHHVKIAAIAMEANIGSIIASSGGVCFGR